MPLTHAYHNLPQSAPLWQKAVYGLGVFADVAMWMVPASKLVIPAAKLATVNTKLLSNSLRTASAIESKVATQALIKSEKSSAKIIEKSIQSSTKKIKNDINTLKFQKKVQNYGNRNTNLFNGLVTEDIMIVDSKGNTIVVKSGQQLTGSKDGKWLQVKNSLGEPTGLRKDGPHSMKTHSDRRALEPHAHIPGISNNDGTPWLPIY